LNYETTNGEVNPRRNRRGLTSPFVPLDRVW